MVGRSAAIGRRFADVVASARSLPLLTCCRPMVTASKVSCTCPPMRSETQGALPLYGTCTSWMPAIEAKSSAARCGAPPLPLEQKLIFPGFAFA